MATTAAIPKINEKHLTISLRLLLFLVIPLIFGLLSLFLGRDINWDLKNYHYYNAYAFLESRMDFDIAPAQLQTFINPIGDVPFYWLTKTFPAWVVGFALGAVHGCNLSLVFMIFWSISKSPKTFLKMFWGICIVVVSAIAPGFVSELGNTMNDNLMSLFVLSAAWLIIAALRVERQKGKFSFVHISWAGLILGIGVGIKPSIAIFAISLAIVLFVFQATLKKRVFNLVSYGLAGLLGTILSTGFWWWNLWLRFGNPFFPFYNHIFKSPYFTNDVIVWSTFLPKLWWEYLAWPFIFSLDGYRVNQLQYFDIRFALLYATAIAYLTVFILKKFGWVKCRDINERNLVFDVNLAKLLLLFFITSYVLWIKESATYRFIIPLELLVPLCFLILLERFIQSGNLRIVVAVSAVCLTFFFFKPFNWGRLNWSDSYFSLDTSRLDDARNPVVIMLGSSPTSYILPLFPKNYRFVRSEGNIFMDANGAPRTSDFLADIKDLLKRQNDNIYILFNKNEKNIQVEQSLKNLDLEMMAQDCFTLKINTPDELEFCHLSGQQ